MFRILSAALLLVCSAALAQTPTPCFSAAAAPATAFAAATIKPPDPNAASRAIGFYGSPGGRIHFGGFAHMLIQYAFGLQDYQVSGGPGWINSDWFEIDAVPPDGSPSHNIRVRNADPTSEQLLMLQSLLRDRFSLQCHMEEKEGEVYILSRGTKPLQLQPPKDSTADPRSIVIARSDRIDGEAVGINTTTDYMALRFSRYLRLPVLNQTGIQGSFDYHLDPVDPENTDLNTALFAVADRLGLKLKKARGTVTTLVVDKIDHPSEN